ncbi:MAG: glycerate kinase [Anaerolineales bacterium]
MNPERFLTHSLRQHPRGAAVARILASAIHAVLPKNLAYPDLAETLNQVHGDIFVLGLGKAAPGMVAALTPRLAKRAHSGLLIPKQAPVHAQAGFEIIPGGHPVPDANSLRAGQRALELAGKLGESDLLLCLISGGGSALMTAPHSGLTLDDLQTLTSALLACGARIDEINTLRRHLDRVKGGGLARAAYPARVVSYLISDVVGNPLESIASGPTAPDPSTKADALSVLEKYALTKKVPAAVVRTLENAPETPKPGDEIFARVENVIVGSNAQAAQAALAQAKAEGFHPLFLGDTWQGEARDVAKELCTFLSDSVKSIPRPFCMLAGGETTVTLHGGRVENDEGKQARNNSDNNKATRRTSRGGRNQELALAAVRELAGLEDVLLITLATDGEDGPTDAAGAVVSPEAQERARALNLDPDAFLERNDSYHFFAPLGDLLQPGPSGTNVNDLTFLFGL